MSKSSEQYYARKNREAKIGQLFIVLAVLIGIAIACSGCFEFAAGAAAGSAAIATLTEQSVTNAVETVNAINEETKRLNAVLGSTKELEVVKATDLASAYGNIRGREKDPVTWIAAFSVLANIYAAGRTKLGVGKTSPTV